jgi:hypothetical protein
MAGTLAALQRESGLRVGTPAALAPVAVIAPSLPLADSVGTKEKPRRAVSHYLWAMLLMELLAIRLSTIKPCKSLVMARIYEAFPLICPICHAKMRIIAFINEASDVQKILDHIGESTQPPRIAPARGPPLWELAEASARAGNDPGWNTAEPEPEIEFD